MDVDVEHEEYKDMLTQARSDAMLPRISSVISINTGCFGPPFPFPFSLVNNLPTVIALSQTHQTHMQLSAPKMLLWMTLVCLWAQAIGSSASILFSGGTVTAFDNATSSLEVMPNGAVLAENDRISQVFNGSLFNVTKPANTEVMNVSGKIVTPGFIDMHHHLWQIPLQDTRIQQ